MSETNQARWLDRSFWPLLAVLLLLAAVLRAGHAETSWSYWTMDYLSYYGPLRDDLSQGLFPWTRLVGLHPPLHGLAVSGILAVGGSVAWVYGLSITLSLGSALLAAVWLRRVAGAGCGLRQGREPTLGCRGSRSRRRAGPPGGRGAEAGAAGAARTVRALDCWRHRHSHRA